MGKCSPKADLIICPVAEEQALLKLIKGEELWRPKNAGPFPTCLMVREFGDWQAYLHAPTQDVMAWLF